MVKFVGRQNVHQPAYLIRPHRATDGQAEKVDKFRAALRFPDLPRSPVLRYVIALAAFAFGLALRLALDPWLGPDRGIVLFLPGMLLTAFFAGLGPAIVTSVLSGLALWYVFLPAFFSFKLTVDGLVSLCTFLFAGLAGIALVHWLRLTHVRLDAERARAEQAEERSAADLIDMTRLNQLGNLLARGGDNLNECLNAALDAAIAMSRADKGNVQLRLSELGALTIAAQRGFASDFLNFFAYVSDDASACSLAMRSGERVIVEDVAASEIFAGQPSRDVLLAAGARAVISTPLMSSGGALLGVISTHFSEPHRPAERALRFIDLLAKQITDYLERRRAGEIEKTLVHEVQHRSNNLLAVIQAIATQSLSGDHSLPQAKKAFEARLQALARAHRQLTKSNWESLSLKDIVRVELGAYVERTAIDGVDVSLSAQQGQILSLALHELTTNAAKYGALSNGTGKVEVSWTTVSEREENLLRLKWRETGGPAVAAPVRQGFGTTLLKAVFSDVRFDYAVDGLKCEFRVGLGRAAPGVANRTALSQA